MNALTENLLITTSRGPFHAAFPVIDAREIDGILVVLYGPMAFPPEQPARNLFAYSVATGEELWRAADLGFGASDAYTNVISEQPLVVGHFAGYACTIDRASGTIIDAAFTK